MRVSGLWWAGPSQRALWQTRPVRGSKGRQGTGACNYHDQYRSNTNKKQNEAKKKPKKKTARAIYYIVRTRAFRAFRDKNKPPKKPYATSNVTASRVDYGNLLTVWILSAARCTHPTSCGQAKSPATKLVSHRPSRCQQGEPGGTRQPQNFSQQFHRNQKNLTKTCPRHR